MRQVGGSWNWVGTTASGSVLHTFRGLPERHLHLGPTCRMCICMCVCGSMCVYVCVLCNNLWLSFSAAPGFLLPLAILLLLLSFACCAAARMVAFLLAAAVSEVDRWSVRRSKVKAFRSSARLGRGWSEAKHSFLMPIYAYNDIAAGSKNTREDGKNITSRALVGEEILNGFGALVFAIRGPLGRGHKNLCRKTIERPGIETPQPTGGHAFAWFILHYSKGNAVACRWPCTVERSLRCVCRWSVLTDNTK